MKKIKKIKGMRKIYLTLFLCGLFLPLNLKKRDSVLQNIVKAMEDDKQDSEKFGGISEIKKEDEEEISSLSSFINNLGIYRKDEEERKKEISGLKEFINKSKEYENFNPDEKSLIKIRDCFSDLKKLIEEHLSNKNANWCKNFLNDLKECEAGLQLMLDNEANFSDYLCRSINCSKYDERFNIKKLNFKSKPDFKKNLSFSTYCKEVLNKEHIQFTLNDANIEKMSKDSEYIGMLSSITADGACFSGSILNFVDGTKAIMQYIRSESFENFVRAFISGFINFKFNDDLFNCLFKEKINKIFNSFVERVKLNVRVKVNEALISYCSKFMSTVKNFYDLICEKQIVGCFGFSCCASSASPFVRISENGVYKWIFGRFVDVLRGLVLGRGVRLDELFLPHVVADFKLLYYFYNNVENKDKISSLIKKVSNDIDYVSSIVNKEVYNGSARKPNEQRTLGDFCYHGREKDKYKKDMYEEDELGLQKDLIKIMKNIIGVANDSYTGVLDNYSNYKNFVNEYLGYVKNVLPGNFEDSKLGFEKLFNEMDRFEKLVCNPGVVRKSLTRVLKNMSLFDYINCFYIELFLCKKGEVIKYNYGSFIDQPGAYWLPKGLNFAK